MKEASALDWYMDLCATAIALSLTESEDSEITHVAGHLLLDGNITPSDRQFHSLLWARLKNAKIFEIEPSLIIRINDGWTNHFQEELEEYDQAYDGLGDFHLVQNDEEDVQKGLRPMTVDEFEKIIPSSLLGALQSLPVPFSLPFDSVFIGIRGGIHKSDYETGKFGMTSYLKTIGYLIDTTGFIVEYQEMTLPSQYEGNLEKGSAFVPCRVRNVPEMQLDGGTPGWDPGVAVSLAPWIITSVIQAINECQHTSVTLGLGDRLRLKALNKSLPTVQKVVPKPYYRVILRDEVVRGLVPPRPPKFHWQYKHQHDVRGHWMTRIRRGPLPLAANDEAKLLKRDYTVYKTGQIPQDMVELFTKRGISLRKSDEWVAILRSWREDFVRPKARPDLPLIEAVRVLPE